MLVRPDQAFTMLIHASQRTNTKLRDVAAELVRTARCAVEADTLYPSRKGDLDERRRPLLVGFGEPQDLTRRQSHIANQTLERLAPVDAVQELLSQFNR